MLGYIGIGVGGALVLTGSYFGIQTLGQIKDSEYEDYRKTAVPEGEDACKYAEATGRSDIVDVCDRNKRDKTLFWVLTPVGAVLAGVGVYLLASGDDKPASSKPPLSLIHI